MEPVSKMSCFSLKKIDDGQSPKKKKIVSVNFSRALFSLLFTHDTLAMQALVWLCMAGLLRSSLAQSRSALHRRI
jgi:hypothetical protein